MRAYVTSGDPLVTTRAGSIVRARYGRTACHWRARGSLQTSGARVTRSTHRTVAAISGVGLRGTAGDACVCLQASPPKVATLRAARDAMVPVVLTGTRGRNNESAHGHRAAPATLRLHPTYRSCVKRRIGTPLQTLLASMTEATRQRCSVSRRTRRARYAWTPGHPSRDVFRQAVSTTAKLLSDRLGDGHYCSPASCDARAVSTTHCALLTRYALTARTKQYGLTFALPSQNFALMLASFNAASSRACLRRPRWATRDASSLRNVRTIDYAVAD